MRFRRRTLPKHFFNFLSAYNRSSLIRCNDLIILTRIRLSPRFKGLLFLLNKVIRCFLFRNTLFLHTFSNFTLRLGRRTSILARRNFRHLSKNVGHLAYDFVYHVFRRFQNGSHISRIQKINLRSMCACSVNIRLSMKNTLYNVICYSLRAGFHRIRRQVYVRISLTKRLYNVADSVRVWRVG